MAETVETGGDQEAAETRFMERFAMIMSDSGYPRMAARVFSAILVSEEGRRTAADLGEQLQVGPPAISGAVKYLMQVGMVTRERDPGDRRDHYRVDQAAWYKAALSSDEVFRRFEEGAREGLAVFDPGTPAGARLDEIQRFFAFLRSEVPNLMHRWQELNSVPGDS
ncbi:GbsR/MarR family transcriptional regulator [Sinosporangium siamense]|uniref:Transcriptional regulator n=1 Tax=Sinosporangium siamense TaxID=1367973 RepID=A0A919RN18_9ACTN|nr:MarR family transcriptional regulator [Sinosporangium siamense]GII96192.1 transcriptional regulator [Sinosporangium siamense]